MADLPDPPLTAADVQKFDESIDSAVADEMIETVWARALSVAACLSDETFGAEKPEQKIELKSIIRTVVLRWADAGSGGVKQRGALDYSETLDATSGGGKLRPNEIRDLQALCGEHTKGKQKAHTILTGIGWDAGPYHALSCSKTFGSDLCDCGAELTASGRPLWPTPYT